MVKALRVDQNFNRMEGFQMRKTWLGVMCGGLAALTLTASGFAAPAAQGGDIQKALAEMQPVPVGFGQAQNYVDADGDGACDNWDAAQPGADPGATNLTWGSQGQNYVDADGDGACDNWNAAQPGADPGATNLMWGSQGQNYVDADGDGVCDNWAGGYGGYVDADGDGVCDNWESGTRPRAGAGRGRGYHGGRR